MAERSDLRALTKPELLALFEARGQPAYRAEQTFRWIHQRGVRSIEEMTDLPASLREELAETHEVRSLTTAQVERAKDGTRKYAFKTSSGDIIESVFIPDASAPGRHTLCISSQVGCAVDCKFCLTASLGLIRNLHFGEIVEQITRVREDLGSTPGKGKNREAPDVGNIVMMGMGEPLQNYSALVPALHTMSDEHGPHISPRRITVSTAGLVSRIGRLGTDTKVNLAVSLNATTDDIRDRIMPINKKWNIAALLEACRAFPLDKRRRITFEYVMLKGLNDTDADARRLAKLVKGIPCKINLIPFNEHPFSPFEKPSNNRVHAFQRIVRDQGLSVFIRTPRGDDISAACGQLGVEVDAPRKTHTLPVLQN